MVRIVIEIDGLKQLTTIHPEYTRQTLDRIERIFLSHGFSAGGNRGSYLIYQCPQSEVETTALLADSLEKCDSYLRHRKRRWISYSLYVFFDEAQENRSVQAQQLISSMYRLPEEDGIWLDERAARILSDRFVVRKQDGVYRVLSGDRTQRREVRSFDDYFAELPIAEACLDSFAPLLQSEEAASFLIRGDDPVCREKLTAALQRSIDGSMRRVYWLELHPIAGVRDGAAILLRGIDPVFCRQVPEHLEPYEQAIWKKMEKLIELSPTEVRRADALTLFTLYLTAYIRYMRTLLLPALVVCHRIEEYYPEQLELLSGICRRFSTDEAFLPLYSSRAELPQELTTDCSVARYDCDQGVTAYLAEDGQAESGEAAASALFFQYCREALQLEDSVENTDTALQRFFTSLPETYLLVLYAFSLFGTLFPAQARRNLASGLGMEQEEMNVALRELETYGLLAHKQQIWLVFPGMGPQLGDYLREKSDYVRKTCALLLPEIRGELAPEKRREFIGIALDLQQKKLAAEVVRELVEENLFRSFDAGIINSIYSVLESVGEKKHRLLPSGLLETVRFEGLLRQGNNKEARKRFRTLFHDEAALKGVLQEGHPHRQAVVGEYLWRSRKPADALPYAKRALLGVQETENLPRILQARILIGKIMLSLGRVDEALEYFRSAKGYSLAGPAGALDLESSAFIALTHFVLGDYSLSLGYIRPALEKAAAYGRREWERYLLMLEGKLQFELGRYGEAARLFQQLLTGELLYFHDQRTALFSAWLYRSLIYRGYTAEGIRRLQGLEDSAEVLLFSAEGYLLDRDLESASSLAERAIELRKQEPRGMTGSAEHLAGDGFASFENILLQDEDVHDLLLRHLKALHGFLASNLDRPQEAERDFEEVLSDKRTLSLDPHRHVYFFFRTLSISEERAEEDVQKLTLLSKAWQNLQKRAGRINDPEDRRSYLTQNYWNSKLFAMSKEHKLV